MGSVVIGINTYPYDAEPDHCPTCHHGIQAIQIGSNVVYKPEREGSILQLLFRCPRSACQRAFIGTYWQAQHTMLPQAFGPFLLRSTAPSRAVDPDVPQEIKALSKNYFEIFRQSAAAETFKLNEIAGGGYRKALEFLIKDYAAHNHTSEAQAIKSKQLGACIKDYISDPNVKACATRAAWLGNDETHYLRKWEEKDIEDLKVLLRLTQGWVLSELLTEKYRDDMK